MKITLRRLTEIILVVTIIIDSCFLYLAKLPGNLSGFLSPTNKIFEGLFVVFAIILCLLSKRLQSVARPYMGYLKKYLTVYVLSIFFVTIATKIKYPSGSNWATYMLVQFMIPLLSYIVIDYLHYSGEESLFHIINVFLLVWQSVLIAQSLLYSTKGILFMAYLNKDTVFLREGNIRIGLGAFGNIMLIYNFYKTVYSRENRKLLEIVNLVLGLYCLLFIQQTRMFTLIIFVIYIYFLVSQGKKLKTIGKNVLIAISGAIALINTGFLNSFIVTFTSSDYEGSSVARQYAYEHFLSVFIANPLFGFGFASPGNYSDLVYGNLGLASVDDVGIVGQMARFGIFAFVIIVPVVLRMFSVCRRLKNNKYTYYPVFVGFSLYVLLTCATLSILDPQRIALLPVLLGLFEYVNYSVEKTQ